MVVCQLHWVTTSDSSGLCWISFDNIRPLVLCYAVSETVGNLMVEQSRLAAVELVGSSEYTSVAADLTSVHGEAEKYVFVAHVILNGMNLRFLSLCY